MELVPSYHALVHLKTMHFDSKRGAVIGSQVGQPHQRGGEKSCLQSDCLKDLKGNLSPFFLIKIYGFRRTKNIVFTSTDKHDFLHKKEELSFSGLDWIYFSGNNGYCYSCCSVAY